MIETKRIILRNQTLNDLNDLYQILSDKETMKYYPKPYTKEATKNWIIGNINSYRKNGFGLWAVVLKFNNKFIGQCGITNQNIDGKIVPEIGFHINKKYWNNGYATESALACLKYGFDKLNLDEIYIHTYVKNIPSIRIAEKIGMIKRKEYDKIITAHNIIMKHVVYSIKKDEMKKILTSY
jgi:RimJ/RimL family protein N-acetyltransferase